MSALEDEVRSADRPGGACEKDQLRRGGVGRRLTRLATVLGLGGSAVVAPQATLMLMIGLVALGLIVVLAIVLILFCEKAFTRFLELIRTLLREPSRALE